MPTLHPLTPSDSPPIIVYLRTLRRRRKLSQAKLAARAAISERQISRWETGQATLSDGEQRRIVAVLGGAEEDIQALRDETATEALARHMAMRRALLTPLPAAIEQREQLDDLHTAPLEDLLDELAWLQHRQAQLTGEIQRRADTGLLRQVDPPEASPQPPPGAAAAQTSAEGGPEGRQ